MNEEGRSSSGKSTPPSDVRHARNSREDRTVLLSIVAFVALFWLLREAFMVVMPVIFALLLALAVWPIVDSIRSRMPKYLSWVGVGVAFFLTVVMLALFLFGLGLCIQQLYAIIQEIGPQLSRAVPGESVLAEVPGVSDAGLDSLTTGSDFVSTAMTALDATTSTFAGIMLVLFLMLLMMSEADHWQGKIQSVSAKGLDLRWIRIARSVGQKFRAYFVTRFVIGVLTAALYIGWMAIFGVDYLLLWGVLAVLLNFIPTIGSIVAGAMPVAYVVLTRDVSTAASVGVGLLVIEQVMGNYLDPKIMGKQLAISPLVVLISLLVWSLLWSIPGAFLAVPLTVLITMVFAHFDRFKPVALMLTDCSSLEELERYSDPDEA